MNKEELKKMIENSEIKEVDYTEHTKYLSDESLILSTEYPKGIEVKPKEIGYSKDENMRIISGKEA